jgi:hypothetical protein
MAAATRVMVQTLGLACLSIVAPTLFPGLQQSIAHSGCTPGELTPGGEPLPTHRPWVRTTIISFTVETHGLRCFNKVVVATAGSASAKFSQRRFRKKALVWCWRGAP